MDVLIDTTGIRLSELVAEHASLNRVPWNLSVSLPRIIHSP